MGEPSNGTISFNKAVKTHLIQLPPTEIPPLFLPSCPQLQIAGLSATSHVNFNLLFIGFVLFCFYEDILSDKKKETVTFAGLVLEELKEDRNSHGLEGIYSMVIIKI